MENLTVGDRFKLALEAIYGDKKYNKLIANKYDLTQEYIGQLKRKKAINSKMALICEGENINLNYIQNGLGDMFVPLKDRKSFVYDDGIDKEIIYNDSLEDFLTKVDNEHFAFIVQECKAGYEFLHYKQNFKLDKQEISFKKPASNEYVLYIPNKSYILYKIDVTKILLCVCYTEKEYRDHQYMSALMEQLYHMYKPMRYQLDTQNVQLQYIASKAGLEAVDKYKNDVQVNNGIISNNNSGNITNTNHNYQIDDNEENLLKYFRKLDEDRRDFYFTKIKAETLEIL